MRVIAVIMGAASRLADWVRSFPLLFYLFAFQVSKQRCLLMNCNLRRKVSLIGAKPQWHMSEECGCRMRQGQFGKVHGE